MRARHPEALAFHRRREGSQLQKKQLAPPALKVRGFSAAFERQHQPITAPQLAEKCTFRIRAGGRSKKTSIDTLSEAKDPCISCATTKPSSSRQ
jgi:hypothetical protein